MAENKFKFNCDVRDGKVYGTVTLRGFNISGGKMPKDKKYVVPQGRQVDFGGVDLREVFAYAMDFWLIKVGKLRQTDKKTVEEVIDQQVFPWGFASDPKADATEEDKVRDTIIALVASMEQRKVKKADIPEIVNATFGRDFKDMKDLDAFINHDGGSNDPIEDAVWESTKKNDNEKNDNE